MLGQPAKTVVKNITFSGCSTDVGNPEIDYVTQVARAGSEKRRESSRMSDLGGAGES